MNENVFIPKVEALKTHEFMVILVDLVTDSYEVLTFTVEAYGPMDAYTLVLHRAWNIIKTTEGYENKIIRHITMDIDNYRKGD